MAMLAAVNAVLTVYIGPVNKLLSSLGGPIATRRPQASIWCMGSWPITSFVNRGRRLSPLRLAARFKL